ncbi:MAG: terpene cyclase/mutase family protein [Planctomycetota bacterium]|nr:terpene cyclase/mutase family protein [Planctomycetota bacterium]
MSPQVSTPRSAVARKPARPIRRLRKRVARSLRRMPPSLIGLVGTLAILTLLAAFLVGSAPKGDTRSSAPAAPGDTDGPSPATEIASPPPATLPFDLPVPETFDTHDPPTREALLSAVQETRELRFVSSHNPWLPDLQQLRQQIRQPAAPRVDLACRDPRVRVQMLQREGGTLLTETAVARGLAWLARQQQSAGCWQLDGSVPSDTVATSVALLPFLGAGQTHVVGRYQHELVQGLRWLISRQRKDGDLRGDSRGHLGMYAQAQGTLALCEALLLTEDPQLSEPARQATDFLLSAQYPDGGWGGRSSWEVPVAERRGDTSVLGWVLLALATARAANLDVPDDTFELASHFLDGVQLHDGAVYAYQRAFPPMPTMTAEALLCRLYLGWDLNSPGLDTGLRLLATDQLPAADQPSVHYWYHATQVFYHVGGPLWSEWNSRMREILVSTQETSGETAGSWEPRGEFAAASGRLTTTALAVCTLQVYYRHLPVLRQLP